ncbi:MAG: MauE/DoxX family redox-associated membrane protein [Thermodesulfobacteriota bacterium]|nr:MauE/DoxX family redox-associated membrane protein [Thermodesulfobacteriota bacterium]
MNELYKTFFGNSWVELAARWILGVTFIYACYNKILEPAVFAEIIYGYDLFPAAFINLIAIIVPFMELVTGLALILGVYPRSAALIVNGMLLVFIIALSINLIRGHEFDCGCFSINSGGQATFAGPLLFRDFILLALGLHVFFYRNPRKLCIHCRNGHKHRADVAIDFPG